MRPFKRVWDLIESVGLIDKIKFGKKNRHILLHADIKCHNMIETNQKDKKIYNILVKHEKCLIFHALKEIFYKKTLEN